MLKYTTLILLSCFSLVSCNEKESFEDKEEAALKALEDLYPSDEAHEAEKKRLLEESNKSFQKMMDTPPRRTGF